MHPTVIITESQKRRMIEIVEECGKVYDGVKLAADEFGISHHICRNIWYRESLSNYLSDEFLANNPRIKVSNIMKFRESMNDEPEQLELDIQPEITTGVQYNELSEVSSTSEARDVLNAIFNDYDKLKKQYSEVMLENSQLKSRYHAMEERLIEVNKYSNQVSEDYRELLSVINKARVLHVNETVAPDDLVVALKMGRNGDLSRIGNM